MQSNAVAQIARDHVIFHHHGADGWITVAKREGSTFRQYHYKPKELAEELTEWLGEDVYFSQNTFYKPYRAIENIRQLRALYVDVDFYMFNYDYRWTVGNVEQLVNDRELPSPNLIINSGRGIVCVWLIDPVPSQALPLWQALQKDFFTKLERFGGDSKATDAARVFRIAGSVNSKNGEEVSVMYRHENRYTLRDLQYEYLPEIKPKTAPKRKGRPSKVVNLYNTFSLHHARLLDLVKLVELRSYDVKGHRETILFLYRYWKCCFLNDADRALEEALVFNEELTEPLSEREVIRATKSAEKAWEAKNNADADRIAREKGYPGAGYNISNTKLISWLDIDAEEMQQLATIIDGNEKRRRKRIANEKMRRAAGMQTRAEYLAAEQEKTEDKLWLLRKAIERHPNATQREIAAYLNWSVSTVNKYKKRL